MSKQFDQLRERINQIRYAATLDIEESSTAHAMVETYKECMKISSTNYTSTVTSIKDKKGKVRKRNGAHAARCEIIRKRLTGEGEGVSIFTAVAQQATQTLEDDLRIWKVTCIKKMKVGSKAVKHDFNRRFEVPDVKKEEGDQEAVEKLQQAASRALEVIHGPMKDLLRECKEWEHGGR